MARDEADAGAVDAQQLPGRLPAILERQVEYDALVHRQAQPGVVEHLALELSGFPAGIAEGDEGVLRPRAAIGVNRPAAQHWLLADTDIGGLEFHLRHDIAELHA